MVIIIFIPNCPTVIGRKWQPKNRKLQRNRIETHTVLIIEVKRFEQCIENDFHDNTFNPTTCIRNANFFCFIGFFFYLKFNIVILLILIIDDKCHVFVFVCNCTAFQYAMIMDDKLLPKGYQVRQYNYIFWTMWKVAVLIACLFGCISLLQVAVIIEPNLTIYNTKAVTQ